MTASTYDRDVSEGRRHAIAGGWAGTDADLYAIGWAAARKAAPVAADAMVEAAGRAIADTLLRAGLSFAPELQEAVVRGLAEDALAAALSIDSWDALWCRSCGNRYRPGVPEDECSCGSRLQAVVVQLVSRRPNRLTPDRST